MNYELPGHVAMSANCRDLLSRILVADPAARITVPAILRHPWFLRGLPDGVAEMNDHLVPPRASEIRTFSMPDGVQARTLTSRRCHRNILRLTICRVESRVHSLSDLHRHSPVVIWFDVQASSSHPAAVVISASLDSRGAHDPELLVRLLPQSLEETERLVQLGMAPADAAAGGMRFGGVDDGFAANLDGILDEVWSWGFLQVLEPSHTSPLL